MSHSPFFSLHCLQVPPKLAFSSQTIPLLSLGKFNLNPDCRLTVGRQVRQAKTPPHNLAIALNLSTSLPQSVTGSECMPIMIEKINLMVYFD